MKTIFQVEELTKQELLGHIDALFEKRLSPLFSTKENTKLSIKEAAEELGVAKLTIHNYIKKGILPAFKIGRRVFIKRQDFDVALSEVKSLKYRR
ncbi:helix-turn-helix domain-containing protein [Bizionia myxarmorum]|uniref:Helix-turn-helix domain-containing protein n=1 Tax=Bizionia myxarmorum TaxID=291186 RepID=A0A5D0QYH7_9FLAO|nr:helix-turn-helix domain-containing protein [Bizionia myxarmorum]TYB74257.1 helix-turn-helix domain-containing protein [Bizionia myxarmorum]